MSKPSATSDRAARPVGTRLEQRNQQRGVPDGYGCRGERHGRARRVLRWDADIEERARGLAIPGRRPAGASAAAALRTSDWKPGGVFREREAADQEAAVRLTVHAQQADGRGNRRLRVLRRSALQARQHGERLPVSHLPQRQRRIVLQRALEAARW